LRRALSRAIGPVGESLVPILERHIWFVPTSAVLSLLSSTLEGMGIGLLMPLLSEVLSGASTTPPAGMLGTFSLISRVFPPDTRVLGVAGCMFALIVVKAALQTTYWVIVASVDGRAGHDIRIALSDRLLSLGFSFFLRQDPTRLVNIVSSESWRASDAVRLAFSITASACAVTAFAALLLAVSWQLTLLVLVGVLSIRLAQLAFSRRLESLSDRVTTTNQELASRMLRIIDAMRLIRIFGQQRLEQRRFTEASERVRRALLDVERNASAIGPLFEVLHAGLFIGILLVAREMALALPAIITFLALLYRMQPHLLSLSQSRLALAALRGPVQEVAWLLDEDANPLPRAGKERSVGLDAPISFEGVSYTYPTRTGGAPVLENVSFSIQPKRAVAVLGPSGSGKTTLVNLICRLVEPDTGSIKVGNQDLADIDAQAWLEQLALAGQDTDLVDGTVADNIAYGCPEATMERITEAARLADADDFIQSLPRGYQTPVGSRGVALSGGQRQRIGIARALLRDPPLLILDEATNAVDGISEASIMKLLDRRRDRRLTLVISHRPSTIASCHDGVVLSGGKVVEAGPLENLAFFREMSASSSGVTGVTTQRASTFPESERVRESTTSTQT